MQPFYKRLTLSALLIVACVFSNSCFVYNGLESRKVVYTPPDWPEKLPGSVFKPNTKGPAPAVLLIHGWAKAIHDERWMMNTAAKRLAERGYYVLNITYRPLGDESFPAQLEDVREALAWMRRNADAEGIDKNRIGVFGYSVGGYLGAIAALDEGNGRSGVKAIVSGAAPLDLTRHHDNRFIWRFLGNEKQAPSLDVLKGYSPYYHVGRSSPPMFIYHGGNDKFVKREEVLDFQKKMERNGVPCEIFWVEDKGHISIYFASGEPIEKSIDFLDRFLK